MKGVCILSGYRGTERPRATTVARGLFFSNWHSVSFGGRLTSDKHYAHGGHQINKTISPHEGLVQSSIEQRVNVLWTPVSARRAGRSLFIVSSSVVTLPLP